MLDVILKRFDQPDEVRTFDNGKFEIVRIGGLTIGRATYQPGWKWSVDVGCRVLQRRARVPDAFGVFRRGHRRRTCSRVSGRHSLLYSARTSRS